MSSGLSAQLKDYLKKSNSANNLLKNENGSSSDISSASQLMFGWFGRKKTGHSDSDHLQQQQNAEDLANGWFNEAQKDPCFPSMSKKQRVIGFFLCLLMGTLCISLASLYIPFLILKARKFAMLYSLGSLFIIFSFSMLWGPMNHIKHLLSPSRLPFTAAYFTTMIGTLYFSLSVQSAVLTVIFGVLQIVALLWYIVSYVPGGQRGLQFFSKIFYIAASKTVNKTLLPV